MEQYKDNKNQDYQEKIKTTISAKEIDKYKNSIKLYIKKNQNEENTKKCMRKALDVSNFQIAKLTQNEIPKFRPYSKTLSKVIEQRLQLTLDKIDFQKRFSSEPFVNTCVQLGVDFFSIDGYLGTENIVWINYQQEKDRYGNGNQDVIDKMPIAENIRGESFNNNMLLHFTFSLSHFVEQNTYDDSIIKMAKYISRMSIHKRQIMKNQCWKEFFMIVKGYPADESTLKEKKRIL